MTDQDRCNNVPPHPTHRRFGLKDCPGVPMTRPEELRAERVTTGRLEGDLRSQTRAARELTAERDAARQELGAAGEVLAVVWDAVERIERARAVYDTTPGEEAEREDAPHEDPARLREQLADAHADCARYATERDEAREELAQLRTLTDAAKAWAEAVVAPVEPLPQSEALYRAVQSLPPSSVPSRRAQEPTAGEARRLLDQAIDTALPLAGRSVRKLLKALRRELARVDAGRAPAGEPS